MQTVFMTYDIPRKCLVKQDEIPSKCPDNSYSGEFTPGALLSVILTLFFLLFL